MSSMSEDLAPLSQAINLRAHRHQVLASNIANADTPQYKARDFNFQEAMSKAMGQRGISDLSMATTHGGHIRGGSPDGMPELKYRSETQSAVDGNTVDMDVERAQMTDNALQYQILTQLISDRFKGMRSALNSQ